MFSIREEGVDDSPSSPSQEKEKSSNEEEDSDGESSAGEWLELADYDEPHMGCLAGNDDFFGSIRRVPSTMEENPLEGAGPPIQVLEEDFDEGMFPSLDPINHPYTTDEDRIMTTNENLSSGDPSPTAKYKARLSSKPMTRPNRGDLKDRQPLTVLVDIGGHKALTLMDSGCTIKALSPTYGQSTGGKVHQLTNPHFLQLGTVGSRANFKYGTIMRTSYSDICEDVYFDVVNIDGYDAIVGTRFMRKHGVQLDFEKGLVLIRGVPAPTLTVGEEQALLAKRSSDRREPGWRHPYTGYSQAF